MPIQPLQLPDAIRPASINWDALGQIGDAVASARKKQRIGEIISQAGNDPTAVAQALGKEGLLAEAQPYLHLAQQQAAQNAAASRHAEAMGLERQRIALAERAATRAEEAANKPAIQFRKTDTGEEVPYIVSPQTQTVKPAPGFENRGGTPNPYYTGKMSETQGKDALYASRMLNAETALSDPAVIAAAQDRVERGKAGIPVVGNSLVSDDYQRFDQASRDLVNAILRRESGAAISQSEFDNARRQYLPQPGDSDAVLKQKANNRAEAIRGFAAGAGPNYRPQYLFDQSGKLVPNSAAAKAQPSTAPTGPTATNSKTGERVRWDGQQWVPFK